MNTRSAIRWGYALCASVAAVVVLVAMAFLYMVIYSHVVHPGEALPYYEQHAQKASPVVGFLLGLPLFYVLGRSAHNLPTALTVWGIFALIACAMVALSPNKLEAAMICLIDLPAKLAALWLGCRSYLRHAAA